MNNIFDYLDWRGDLTFQQDDLNEVDSLIFSVLAYLEFSGIVPGEGDEGAITLEEACERYKQIHGDKLPPELHSPFFREIPKLFYKAASSTRFKDTQLSSYINLVDFELSNQFSATVFSLDEEKHFIAFRGTDNTLAGWKEDFQMSFREEVKAQRDAVLYTGKIMESYQGRFYLGGHSKGGNLAVYAGAAMKPHLQERILGVYNNDGPGFMSHVIQGEGYQRILHRIHTFVPKSSVVGILLEHGEEFITVNSNGLSFMQHNPLLWDVKGKHFVYEKGLTKGSKNLNTAVRLWLNQLSMEERAEFVDALFDIVQATGAMTVNELSQNKLSLANDMIKSYKNMDPVAKDHLKNVLKKFFEKSQQVWLSSIEKDVASLGEGVASLITRTPYIGKKVAPPFKNLIGLNKPSKRDELGKKGDEERNSDEK